MCGVMQRDQIGFPVAEPAVDHLVDPKAVVAFEKLSSTRLFLRQRPSPCDGQPDVTGCARLIVHCTASAHAVHLVI